MSVGLRIKRVQRCEREEDDCEDKCKRMIVRMSAKIHACARISERTSTRMMMSVG